ncbi:hypothetical protein [Hymenobacter koreensis]
MHYPFIQKLAQLVGVPYQDPVLKERMKHVSIRGRVAFCIVCLEIAIHNLKFSSPASRHLLAKLWDYVSSCQLDIWHEEMAEYLPSSIIETERFQEEDFDDLSEYNFGQLRNWYQTLPKGVVDMIECIFVVGTVNLYGEITGYSTETLKPTMRVAGLMQQLKLPLPEIARFEKSAFADFDGWGKQVDKSFFALG